MLPDADLPTLVDALYAEDQGPCITGAMPDRHRLLLVLCNETTAGSWAGDPLAERPNLDFSKGVRGKYAPRIHEQGTNVAPIDPDLLDTFPDSKAVNDALRSLKRIATRTTTPRRKTASA